MSKVFALCGTKSSGKDSYLNRMLQNLPVPVNNVKFADVLVQALQQLPCFGCHGDSFPYSKRDDLQTFERNDLLNAVEHLGSLGNYVFQTDEVDHLTTLILKYGLHNGTINHDGWAYTSTWRNLAQLIATEGFRQHIHKDFFVHCVEQTIDDIRSYDEESVVLLTDVRFENEIKVAHQAVLFVREDDKRTVRNDSTHDSEKLGEYIAVQCNMYLRDANNPNCRRDPEQHLDKLKDKFKALGVPVHAIYQSYVDADGKVCFRDIYEAWY